MVAYVICRYVYKIERCKQYMKFNGFSRYIPTYILLYKICGHKNVICIVQATSA